MRTCVAIGCLWFVVVFAGMASAQDSEAVATFAPPISGELYRFDDAQEAGRIVAESSAFSVVEHGGRKVVRVTLEPSGGYPGVRFPAPAGGWNLSAFGGVQVDVTNSGKSAVRAVLRVDNEGDWRKSPWNTASATIEPGQTKTIRVQFGMSDGAPGYELNAGRVVRALVFVPQPREKTELLIDQLKAYGSSSGRDVDAIGDNGTVVAFEDGKFDVAKRVQGRGGATARVVGKQLEAGLPAGAAVALQPNGKRWDLSVATAVQMDVTNDGEAPARVTLSAESGKLTKSSDLLVGPHKSANLSLPIGKSYGDPGEFDPTNVTRLVVSAQGPARLRLGPVTSTKRPWADVPEWLGARPPVPGDWVRSFNDDFDGAKLDTTIWTTRRSWNGPAEGEIQRYVDENAYVEKGVMRIKAEKRAGHEYDDPKLGTRPYTAAMVSSMPWNGNKGWVQAYGYFESRMKLPATRGLWPAFWMMPDRGPAAGEQWKRQSTSDGGMEVDILEHLSEWGDGRYNVAAHWDGYGKDHQQWGTDRVRYLPTRDGWHTWGLLWEPGKLTWYCDGVKKVEWTHARVGTVPMHWIFCIQMGGWATKDVEDSKLPDYLQVEYVRAWQLRQRVGKQ